MEGSGRHIETQMDLAAIAPFEHLGCKAIGKHDPITGPQSLRRPGEGEPLRFPDLLVQGHRDTSRTAQPLELRRDDPRVVHHQQASRVEQLGQVGDDPVGNAVPQIEQTRGIARLHGALRNPVRRQVEIEVRRFHAQSPDRAVVD